MPLIKLDQLIDKNLYAKKNVPIITNPFGENKNQIGIAQAGNLIGTIYSWVQKSPSEPLYFQFYTPAPQNKAYYVEYKDGLFNYALLKEQGVQTVKEEREEKEEANKSTTDKVLDYVKKYALWAGVVYGAYLFYKARKTN